MTIETEQRVWGNEVERQQATELVEPCPMCAEAVEICIRYEQSPNNTLIPFWVITCPNDGIVYRKVARTFIPGQTTKSRSKERHQLCEQWNAYCRAHRKYSIPMGGSHASE